jgi:hypothetical protein
MKHREYTILLSGYLDGELDGRDRENLTRHLEQCALCRAELSKLKETKEVLENMTIQKPKDEVWNTYWSSVYNRLERRAGWIFFSLGMILLVSIGIFEFVNQILRDHTVSLVAKLGIFSAILGGVILLVSVIKEQVFTHKRQRYKEIEK